MSSDVTAEGIGRILEIMIGLHHRLISPLGCKAGRPWLMGASRVQG